MRVGLVACDGCFGSGIVSMLDVLGAADVMRGDVDPSIAPISVDVVGVRRTVTASSGVVVPATAGLEDLSGFDLVAVAALGTLDTDSTLRALDRADVRRIMGSLGRVREDGARLAAACTGSFAVAETGLLDGGRATTSWWLGPAFRTRYPRVELDLESMVVTDERAITAGAAFAHIDLALTLVRRASPTLAELVSRLLIVDERPSQATYLAMDHLEHRDPVVLAFEEYARAHLAEPISVAAAARTVGVSRRTLERRVADTLGMSPLALVQRLRAERARHLLRTTDLGVEQVAPRVGYANAGTLRALLRRHAAGGMG